MHSTTRCANVARLLPLVLALQAAVAPLLAQTIPPGKLPDNLIPGATVSRAGEFELKQFLSPTTCGDCHSGIYEQWNGSVHNHAFVDPVWQAVAKAFVAEATSDYARPEALSCVRCHAPIAYVTGQLKTTEGDFQKVNGAAKLGVSCDFCHSVKASAGVGNGAYVLAPGEDARSPGTKRAQLRDAKSPFHQTAYSELHTRSEFCGMCHDVSHVTSKLAIEQTYTEWREGPYHTDDPKTTVHCQDCHMRQQPGVPATGMTERPDNPGQACDGGPQRDHLFTHYFVGANSAIPALMGSKVHSEMAVERLRHAAMLQVSPPAAIRKGRLVELNVRVTNTGAGHYLPTGLSEVRQMWLHVVVTDADGKTIFESGAVAENGDVDGKAVMYHTVLGDADGKAVLNVALATRVLSDHRIAPKQTRTETYSFVVPQDARLPIRARVVLRYRSASQGVVNAVMKDKAPKLPIVAMAEAQAEF